MLVIGADCIHKLNHEKKYCRFCEAGSLGPWSGRAGQGWALLSAGLSPAEPRRGPPGMRELARRRAALHGQTATGHDERVAKGGHNSGLQLDWFCAFYTLAPEGAAFAARPSAPTLALAGTAPYAV